MCGAASSTLYRMTTINLQDRNVANLTFDAAGHFTVTREFDAVTIRVPISITILPEPAPSWLCEGVCLDLYGLQPNGVERLLASGFLCEVLGSRQTAYTFTRQADLRCSVRAIASYEEFRDGETVYLRLKWRANMCELESGTGYHRIQCEPHYIYGEEDFRADKEKWVNPLRSAGLSCSLLVEIPFPTSGEVVDEGLRALSDALSSFENGGATAWKDCVGHLRSYLEKWNKQQPNAPKEPKDGSPADRDWKLLNLRDALYKTCHYWVHESASACGRDDALLLMSSVAGLLRAYRSPR